MALLLLQLSNCFDTRLWSSTLRRGLGLVLGPTCCSVPKFSTIIFILLITPVALNHTLLILLRYYLRRLDFFVTLFCIRQGIQPLLVHIFFRLFVTPHKVRPRSTVRCHHGEFRNTHRRARLKGRRKIRRTRTQILRLTPKSRWSLWGCSTQIQIQIPSTLCWKIRISLPRTSRLSDQSACPHRHQSTSAWCSLGSTEVATHKPPISHSWKASS